MNNRLKNYISVAVFAFLGGALRSYLTVLFAQIGTIIVNLTGCFLLAFFTYFFVQFREKNDWLATGLSTGFVGSFTTFSSFNLDILKQIQLGKSINALVYFIISILLGFLFAVIGRWFGNKAGMKLGSGYK